MNETLNTNKEKPRPGREEFLHILRKVTQTVRKKRDKEKRETPPTAAFPEFDTLVDNHT